MAENPLGRRAAHPAAYSPDLLFTVPRADGRYALGLHEPLPFTGCDLWTAWELSWLDADGCPVVAVLTAEVPADSPNLVESKSLKLYLNSFAMERFESSREVQQRIKDDLNQALGCEVKVAVITAQEASHDDISELPGRSIDNVAVTCTRYTRDPALLKTGKKNVHEILHSHLLRSVCPVTGQPDTGSVMIEYRGRQIEHDALLAYLVSFREHADFHELCVERMFCDISKVCDPEELTVYARYNRRGGIDINPFRSNVKDQPPRLRLWRQ